MSTLELYTTKEVEGHKWKGKKNKEKHIHIVIKQITKKLSEEKKMGGLL